MRVPAACLRTFASASRVGPTSPGAGSSIPKDLPQKRELDLRRLGVPQHRDQRHVLLDAALRELRALGRCHARRLRLRGQGAALSHAHAEAQQRRGAARQFLRLGRAAARRQARPDPLAVPAELPLQPREARDLLQAAAARHRAGRCLRPPARPSAEGAGVAAHRPASADPSCHGDSPRELPRSRLHRAAAQARHRAGLRRHRRVAAADGSHRGLRLRPPARLDRALSQRLQPAGAEALGRARGGMARRQADDRWPFHHREAAKAPAVATCSSISTTPTSCRRPRTRCP